MAREYNEINEVDGPVSAHSYTKVAFEATLRRMRPSTAKQTLSAAGALDLDKVSTQLSSSSGTYAITIAAGDTENQVKEIYMIGSGGTWTLTGSGGAQFWDFTSLVFDSVGRSALLRWVGGKWLLVGGNVSAL